MGQDKDYMITATVKKYPSNAMAYLQYRGLNGEVKDSVAIEDGNFAFKGRIDEPRPVSIVIREPGKKATSQHIAKFYIEPGELTIVGKSMLFNASITGSPATLDKKELDKLLGSANFAQPEKVAVEQVTQIVAVPAGSRPPSAISQGRGRPMPGGTVVSRRTITDINELPYEMQSAIKAMREEAKDKVLKFIKDHPNSFVSMYTLNSLWVAQRITYMEYLSLMNILGPNLMQSNEGKVMFAR